MLHPPSRLLLRSLASTDLCVGLLSQPLAALHAISILTENLLLYQFTVVSTYFTSAVLSGVSLFVNLYQHRQIASSVAWSTIQTNSDHKASPHIAGS